jgi:hypothetical protein
MGRSSVHDVAAFKWYRDTYNPATWAKHFISGWNSTYFYNNVITSAEGQHWHKNFKTTMTAMIREHSDEWNTDPFGNIVAVFGRKGHLSKFYCLNDGKTYTSQDAGWTDQ